MHAGKTLDRAIHVGRGPGSRDYFEWRERRATLLARGVLAGLYRHGRQRHVSGLQRYHQRSRVAVGDRAPLFGEAKPPHDERERAGGGGGNVEASVFARHGAFERLDDEDVRRFERAGVGSVDDASDTPRRGGGRSLCLHERRRQGKTE